MSSPASPNAAVEAPDSATQPVAEQGGRRPVRPRVKLGLALAGGGFRASLFHVGVLRRLAELDLLRRVEVLSTVSGGSIVGALYVLHLKAAMQARLIVAGEGPLCWSPVSADATPVAYGGTAHRLTRDEYVALVDRVEADLTAAVEKNLRTRLLLNPLSFFGLVVSDYSLGARMARLYERYLYRGVVDRLRDELGALTPDRRPWPARVLRPGVVPLVETRPIPDLDGGLDGFNRRESEHPMGSAVTHHVLNATTINTGGHFFFASNEVGDWYLGYARTDPAEVRRLSRFKDLLERLPAAWRLGHTPDVPGRAVAEAQGGESGYRVGGQWHPARRVRLALWLRAPRTVPGDADWGGLLGRPGVATLASASLGYLRLAKLSAWYLREGLPRGLDGGLRPWQHDLRLRRAVRDISGELADELWPGGDADPAALPPEALDFFLELYYLRSAAALDPRFYEDLGRFTLGDAVGASACFPPVFAPIMVHGLYDDAVVKRLGLTDGGVFDNVGLQPLFDEGCTDIIASDTGGVFDPRPLARSSRLALAFRLTDIFRIVLGRRQREALREYRRARRAADEAGLDLGADGGAAGAAGLRLRSLAYFHIQSPPVTVEGAVETGLDRHLLARLRTDLDAFSAVERAALVNHGYAVADAYVRRYLAVFRPPGTDVHWRPGADPAGDGAAGTPRPPHPLPLDEAACRELRVGRHRFFRPLLLGRPGPWAFLLAAAALLGVLGWRLLDGTLRVPVAAWLLSVPPASWAVAGVEWVLATWPWLGTHWPHLLLAGALLGGVGALAAGAVRYRLEPGSLFVNPRRRRARATFAKWGVLLARGFLLFPVAVAVVAVVCLVALVSQTLFLLARLGRQEER
ncbi:MAG TPA: patatin-like phospholipase family protein [Rubricoccaceae bacterium]|nr:patatin-like phospholipase family protein [Rubricoccaceae bacterium]